VRLIAAFARRKQAPYVAVTVVTVDDQAVFRAAARDVIEATPGFESVGEAESCEEALIVLGDVEPRLVLVDVRMPGADGIETAMRIRDDHPNVVVVLISIEDTSRMPSTVGDAGAAALVRKQDFCPALLRELWESHGRTG
jgi:two-component system, NarL family, invasion response regulator UvrY